MGMRKSMSVIFMEAVLNSKKRPECQWIKAFRSFLREWLLHFDIRVGARDRKRT